jgi:mRNA-degrading endonuclease RelE of RelBE toxin-antitoxin system
VKFLDLNQWKIEFKPGWDRHFKKFDKTVQTIILNKLEKMKEPSIGRGLHSSRYLIEEAGQYRIAFIQDEKKQDKIYSFCRRS